MQRAMNLDEEPEALRERYGMNIYGQRVLLAAKRELCCRLQRRGHAGTVHGSCVARAGGGLELDWYRPGRGVVRYDDADQRGTDVADECGLPVNRGANSVKGERGAGTRQQNALEAL